MRKRNSIKKLGRKVQHRKSLIRNQLDILFSKGILNTTSVKAKVIKKEAETLIGEANKRGVESFNSIRFFQNKLNLRESIINLGKYVKGDKKAVKIVKTGFRKGDNAETSQLLLVDFERIIEKKVKKIKDKKEQEKKDVNENINEESKEKLNKPKKDEDNIAKRFSKSISKTLGGNKERARSRSGL